MTAMSELRLSADPLTDEDLLRLVYGGGRRELVDGCLVITREVGHYRLDDLLELPEDGRKHELLDGQIVVSPGARPLHQRAVARLIMALNSALPAGLEALPSPVDVHIPGPLPTKLLPDVVVVPAITVDTETVARPVVAVDHGPGAGRRRLHADGVRRRCDTHPSGQPRSARAVSGRPSRLRQLSAGSAGRWPPVAPQVPVQVLRPASRSRWLSGEDST